MRHITYEACMKNNAWSASNLVQRLTNVIIRYPLTNLEWCRVLKNTKLKGEHLAYPNTKKYFLLNVLAMLPSWIYNWGFLFNAETGCKRQYFVIDSGKSAKWLVPEPCSITYSMVLRPTAFIWDYDPPTPLPPLQIGTSFSTFVSLMLTSKPSLTFSDAENEAWGT